MTENNNFFYHARISSNMDIQKLKRASLINYISYTPGEQPSANEKWIKLNTNENPYSPPKEVIEEIKEAVSEKLRLYPDPTCKELRKTISSIYLPNYGISSGIENILVGNGSDEILDILFKAFVDPNDSITYFKPSYGMYTTLADLYCAKKNIIPLTENFEVPNSVFNADAKGKLLIICSPNNPSAKIVPNEKIEEICKSFDGLVVVDEAYGNFTDQTALSLLEKCKNLAVIRTFSKGFSLASQRVGFIVASAEIIQFMNIVKLPYNVPYLSQIAGIASIKNIEKFNKVNRGIVQERNRITEELSKIGVKIYPSDANFILVKIPGENLANKIFKELKTRKILVRYFNQEGLTQYLRVTIGKKDENEIFLNAFREISQNLLK